MWIPCILPRVCVSFVLAFGAPLAAAQAYPAKPVRILVPFGAGGVADITARVVAQAMSGPLGQQVLVENRPGAGGVAASSAVAQAEPDGHTLLFITNGNAVSATLFKSLPYDTLTDFAPISTVGFFDLVFLARPGGAVDSIAGFVARAKAHPGKLNIATINPGSTQNLAAELLKMTAGIDAQIVPYKATPEVLLAVRAGDADLAVEILAPALAQIRSGALRPLAIAAARRSVILPELPTVSESGVPGYEASSWNGLAAPAKTPAAIVARLNREVNAAIAAPEVRQRLHDLGIEARAGTPGELRRQLEADIAKWRRVIERASIARQG
jgi:tripartite-type tricarboxylate transporter receptor subunit TctC